jgi:prepilin-type N-terminal cleavage/methylation domain-containing protein
MRSERGFSLIEIMTAMAITMVVLSLTFKSFSDALKVDDAMKLMTEVDQNLQSASTYMVRDMIDTARNWPTSGIPLPSGAGAVALVRPGTAADAAAGYPLGATSLLPLMPGDGLGPTIGSTATDTITMCYMDGILGEMPVTSLTRATDTVTMVLDSAVTINTRPENTIAVGDLFYILNGSNRALQRVTALNVATKTLTFDMSADTMKVNQPNAASGNVTALLNLTDNKTQRVMMITYYIDNSTGVPMLMRQSNTTTALGVALGINNLQVSYNAHTGTSTGSTALTNTIYGDGYTPSSIDQGLLALSARSDRVLRLSNRYISNDMVTQVGFRSLSTTTAYTVTASP